MDGCKKYLPHDLATIAYLSVIIILTFLFGRGLQGFLFHLTSHSLILIFIIIALNIIHQNNNKFFTFVHYFYPFILFMFLYEETGIINTMFFSFYFDGFLRNCDIAILGFSPCETFAAAFPSPYICEYMHFVYFCYYLLIPGIWWYLYLNKKDMLREYTFTICLSFYICYLCYVFFPAAGGKAFTDIYGQKGFYFTKFMHYIYLTREKNGGAFPSSHVALSLIALLYSRSINNKIIVKILSVIVLSLIISTVYCGYHFAIDVFAGMIIGTIFYSYIPKVCKLI